MLNIGEPNLLMTGSHSTVDFKNTILSVLLIIHYNVDKGTCACTVS